MNARVLQLRHVQANYEARFSCVVCLAPKLRMIYGQCQHRLCEECLFGNSSVRRNYLDKCPTCQMEDSFPKYRVDIPDDNIEAQKLLGVRECTVDGCNEGFWEWELQDHMASHFLMQQRLEGQADTERDVEDTENDKRAGVRPSKKSKACQRRTSMRISTLNRNRPLRQTSDNTS